MRWMVATPGRSTDRRTVDRLMVAMPSHPEFAATLLRKASRIAGRLNQDWCCVYVQTPEESASRIDATRQRRLVDNIQRAQALGAEVIKLQDVDVAGALLRFARERGVTVMLVGQSRQSGWRRWARSTITDRLIADHSGIDVMVVSLDQPQDGP